METMELERPYPGTSGRTSAQATSYDERFQDVNLEAESRSASPSLASTVQISKASLIKIGSNADDGQNRNYKTNFPAWVPFFLRSSTIIGFAVAYLLLLVTLVGLQIYDKQHKGLATTESNKQFLWTYGPTAGK